MTRRQAMSAAGLATATREDPTRIPGDLGGAETVEILALHPTVPEAEQAALWAGGA